MSKPFEPGAKMTRWGSNLSHPEAVMKQIGIILVAETLERFDTQTTPHGQAWEKRGVPNVFGIIQDFHQGKPEPPQRRFIDSPVLRDTGRLASSISFRLQGATAVEVGTNLPYAPELQRGGISESEKITDKVASKLYGWLKGKGAKWKGELGWLLNKKFRGKRLEQEIEPRPFIGVSDDTIENVRIAIGVKIFVQQG